MALTARQQRFVVEYVIDLNATQAAIRAGYSPKAANREGHRLLTNVDIAAAIRATTTKQVESLELTAARVLEEYRRLAFCDMRTFFDADGNLKRVQDLTPEQGSALSSLEVIIKNAQAGDNQTDTVHKFRIWDKTRALESLAKHFGLLTEKVDVQGAIELSWRSSE